LKIFKQYFNGCGFNIQGEKQKCKQFIQNELRFLEQAEEDIILKYYQFSYRAQLKSEQMAVLEEGRTKSVKKI